MASQTPPGWARDFSPTAKNSTATRILVVDDEPLVRWSVSETLGSLGWEVLEAGDGQSAIRAVSDRLRHVDIVFLDLWLPDSNDLRVLAAMRRLSPKTPIILMTAHGTPETVTGASKLGAFAVINKPFELDELAPLVHSALRPPQPV